MRLLSCLQPVALTISLLALAPAQGDTPQRTVNGHTLVSSHDPKVEIGLPAAAAYVGADTWLLKAYADDIELHAFVTADAHGQIQRLYWVQFEAYLPSRPELKHSYDSKRHVEIGGLDFLVDTWVESTGSTDEPDSDSAHLKALLRAAGYTLPPSMLSVRFVHLMDGARKELMFIYSEAAPPGLTAEDLKKGGKAYDQWPGMEKGLIERGQMSIQLH